MSDVLLSIQNLTMKFGGVTALGEVNLDVKTGEILALIHYRFFADELPT